MVRFSQLVIEQPWVKEVEINPLIATSDRIIAVDVRTVLWGSEKTAADLPGPVIRPYPTQYVTQWTMDDKTPVTIRPIRPEDEPLLVKFHKELSDRSVMLRYFHPINLSQRVSHERLIRVCFNDYDRELALVAEGRTKEGERFIMGIGRLSKLPEGDDAEFAMVISDPWQKRGLGTKLIDLLLQAARAERIGRVSAIIMGENLEMQHVCEKAGFKLTRSLTDNGVSAEIGF